MGIARGFPRGNLLDQGGLVRDAAVEALPAENTQFDLTEPISLHVLRMLLVSSCQSGGVFGEVWLRVMPW